MIKNLTISTSLVAFSIMTPLLAQAASENPTLNDTFSIRAGGFLTSIDTNLTINGSKFDFEEVLDDSVTTGSIQALWRISNKLRMNFGYWAVERSEATTLGQADNIGGINVPAGSGLSATFNSSYLNAAIGYSFVRNDNTEFGADFGLAALGLNTDLGASVPGLGEVSFTAFDETYFLPTIGVYVTHALSPMWSISGRFGAVGLDLGDAFKGSVIEANAAVEFRPWQNFGLGLAYLFNSADATLNNLRAVDSLDVEWKFQGPVAYLTLGF